MSNPMQGNANAKSVLDWRNVTNYGADPTGTNDSTVAFSNFTTAVGADGVGVIPSGTYKVTSMATFDSGATYLFAPGALLLLNGVPQQRLSYYHPAGEPYNVLRETFASGSDATTTGSMDVDSYDLTGVASTTGWSIGMGISVAGAGASGALLVSQVTAISGTTFTLADSAGTAVTAATVSHDDTAALAAAATAAAGTYPLIIPQGTYLNGGITLASNLVMHILGTLKMRDTGNAQLVGIPQTGTVTNITIDGHGLGVLDGNASGQTTANALACLFGGSTSTSNVTVRGLTLTNALNWPMNLVAVKSRAEYCTFSDSKNFAFFGHASDDCHIVGCKVFTTGTDWGLGFYGGVTNCTMERCEGYGGTTSTLPVLGVGSDSSQPNPSSDVIISDCIAHDCWGSGFFCSGVSDTQRHTHISFLNCIGHHNNQQNATADGSGGLVLAYCEYVEVANCQFHHDGNGSAGASGIWLNGVSYAHIHGCSIYNEGQGITANGYGILLSSAETAVDHILVENNNLFDDQTTPTTVAHVDAHAGASITVTGNKIGAVASTGAKVYGLEYMDLVAGNEGYNPVGVPTVAVPSSGTAVASSPLNRTFYVTAASGGCTMAVENGPSVVVPASALGTILVPAGATVTPTYTTAPTWTVEEQ